MHVHLEILLDVDGVLGDLHAVLLAELNGRLGTNHKLDGITTWDMSTSLGVEPSLIHGLLNTPGLCASVPPFPEAQSAVGALRAQGHRVYAITHPWPSPTWGWERTCWLHDHFQFTDEQILLGAPKYLVDGDVLIDDGLKYMLPWAKRRPAKLGLLWDKPWNQSEQPVPPNVRRLNKWDDALWIIKAVATYA